MRTDCPGRDVFSFVGWVLMAVDVSKLIKMSKDNSGMASENSFLMISFTCLAISFTQIVSQTMPGFPAGNYTFPSDLPLKGIYLRVTGRLSYSIRK